MKKAIKFFGVLSFVLLIFVVSTAFIGVNSSAGADDYSCVVSVKTSDGSAAAYVKVTTEVSGGISCIGGRDFETDAKGKATLFWSKGCKLKKVYVKGTGYSVDYQDGGSYTLTLD